MGDCSNNVNQNLCLFAMKVTTKSFKNKAETGQDSDLQSLFNKDHFLTAAAIGYRRINYVLSAIIIIIQSW